MKCLSLFCSIGLVALGCNHDQAADATPISSAAVAAATASVAPDMPASAAALDSAAPAATAPVAPVAPVAPDVVAKIPAEEDFEPRAATTITAANASQQLAAIEKEIAK